MSDHRYTRRRGWGLVVLGLVLFFLAIASPELGRIWKARIDPTKAKAEQRSDTMRTGLCLVAQEQVRDRLFAPKFSAQRDVSVSANGRAWVVAVDVESQGADGSPMFSRAVTFHVEEDGTRYKVTDAQLRPL